MFERFTQNARRVIFLAREEATQYGSRYIESEHLLLGTLRENGALATRIGRETDSINSFRKEIESVTIIGDPLIGSPEVPLSADSKRILTLAAREADDLGHEQIALGHFLLGMLRVEKCIAAKVLQTHGATLVKVRAEAIREMR
jgi:ATP-dependent Clp protease ATP-binding subunit ClpC